LIVSLYYFVVHNITWRALPVEYGHWNSVWNRFWRLSQTGFFEAFFEALPDNSTTAHLVVMFDSTIVRAHVSAAGAKGGKKLKRLDVHAEASRPKFILRRTWTVSRSLSI
jgi:transposase